MQLIERKGENNRESMINQKACKEMMKGHPAEKY